MRDINLVPVVVDNLKERRTFVDVFRSLFWKLSPSYRRVKTYFTDRDGEYYIFKSDDAFKFVEILTILDLSMTSYMYMQCYNDYFVWVKTF